MNDNTPLCSLQKHVILISFDAKTFSLLENNQLKFEYRKNLPDSPFVAYFYISRPIMAISGVAHFGKRELLSSWLLTYGKRSEEIKKRISEFLNDCRFVAPLLTYQHTSYISLSQITKVLPNFCVPRMYYYIDDSPLLTYLQNNLEPRGEVIKNSFDFIEDKYICNC